MMKEYNINQTTMKILGLYRTDYRRTLHVRHIAREVVVDVKAVQLQLKRLEKMNVLLSRLRGKNKEYFLNLTNSLTIYYVVLAETFVSINYLARNFLIKKIVNEIGNRVEDPLILFGSFAKGEATKESDVDLFVLKETRPGVLLMNAIRKVSDLVGRQISVKSATKQQFLRGLEKGDPLIAEVVSNHVLLKGADDFCDILWRYYAR